MRELTAHPDTMMMMTTMTDGVRVAVAVTVLSQHHDIFKRKTPTRRYCYHCKRGFCEGIHGTFEGKKMGICLQCYRTK